MNRCPSCGKLSIIQEFVWINSKLVLKERCCNLFCKAYKPYELFKWK